MSHRLKQPRFCAPLALVSALALSACAGVPQRTDSSPALALVRGRSVADVQARIVEVCARAGGAVLEHSTEAIDCTREVRGGRAVLGSLLTGGEGPPEETISFVMIPRGPDVMVTWSDTIDTHSRDRALRHIRLSNAANAQMRNALEALSAH